MPARVSSPASAITWASSSGVSTWPCASTRSVTPKRQGRGTSGSGLSRKMSYCAKRSSRPISTRSRKPAVVSSAVRAPLRSISALVASVVPRIRRSTRGHARPAWPSSSSMPCSTAVSGASGVVSSLADQRRGSCSRTISVNVPPTSTATRTGAVEADSEGEWDMWAGEEKAQGSRGAPAGGLCKRPILSSQGGCQKDVFRMSICGFRASRPWRRAIWRSAIC